MLEQAKMLWSKVMDNSQQFLNDLQVYLENLNAKQKGQISSTSTNQVPTQGTSNVQVPVEQPYDQTDTTQGNGDILGDFITSLQKPKEEEDTMASLGNPDGERNAISGVIPKTLEATPSVSQQVVNNNSNKNTSPVVAKPSTIQKAVQKLIPTQITGIAPEIITKYKKLYGVSDDHVVGSVLKAAKDTGADSNILFKFADAESNFDPKAGAKTSSAKGLFQFTNSTWNYVMNGLGGKRDFKLKGNVHDPYENAVAAALYMNDIKSQLAPMKSNGQVSPTELYLGHFAGPGVAKKVIKLVDSGKGSSSAIAAFSSSQINANKPIFYKKDGKLRSITEVMQVLSGKVA